MRVHPRRHGPPEHLHRRISRLDRLPLRPLTARLLIGGLPPVTAHHDEIEIVVSSKMRSATQVDPGYAIGHAIQGAAFDPLGWIADAPWWSNQDCGRAADLIGRLWRHSVAVSTAARFLAVEANAADPDRVARAGLLCRLGWWAVTAVDPDWMLTWWNSPDQATQRRLEIGGLGMPLSEMGRRLAERWGCEPLVSDVCWLHDFTRDDTIDSTAAPDELAMVQDACQTVAQTPWSLSAMSPSLTASAEPRLRILVAEVQARTAAAFVAIDATAHEEAHHS